MWHLSKELGWNNEAPWGIVATINPNHYMGWNFMDFIVGLHKVGNKYVIMVVVEYLSKYAHFFILKKPYMPLIITQVFMDHILNYLEFLLPLQ